MLDVENPIAVAAMDAAPRAKPSNYPEPFASRMSGREKRPLGDIFGLDSFGVNLSLLAPNAVSSLLHAHTKQDEFIYILQGTPNHTHGRGAYSTVAWYVCRLQSRHGKRTLLA